MANDRTTLTFGAIAGLSLFSANLVGAFSSYYQSQLKMVVAFPATVIAYSIYIAVSLTAIFPCASGSCDLLSSCFEFLNFLLLYRKFSHIPVLHFDLSVTLSLFKESFPLGLMTVMTMLCSAGQYRHFQVSRERGAGYLFCRLCIVEPALMALAPDLSQSVCDSVQLTGESPA